MSANLYVDLFQRHLALLTSILINVSILIIVCSFCMLIGGNECSYNKLRIGHFGILCIVVLCRIMRILDLCVLKLCFQS